ncbi:Protein of unknown function (DUF784) [Quillaja saponaria]|uniref:Prolamin-like domain-containing protein n=1 Tax=Quillaja saponaria TaxID=32244 RepID=A0AAD7VL13_QUISA|nr:Protein of unknown function (DUF784) [Quillaja saponaria]
MAKHFDNKFAFMAAMCFAVIFSAGLAAEDAQESIAPAFSPGPAYEEPGITLSDPVLPPEPSPGYYKDLQECADKITFECNKEIFAGMFFEKELLTLECCKQLVYMGKDCHSGLVKVLPHNP